MLLETLSTPVSKAFMNGNSQNTPPFTPPLPQEKTPGYVDPNSGSPGGGSYDGVVKCGLGGEYGPNRLFVQPYAMGTAGDQFSMRVYGWRNAVQRGINDREWAAYPLLEVLCTVGSIPGPTETTGTFGVGNTENYCDDIALVAGSVGLGGEIVSFGAGSGLIAWLMLDVRGSRLAMFDFASLSIGIGMNALWAKA